MSNSLSERKTSTSVAVLLFCGFFCLYLVTVPDRLPEGDEGILLGVADRIAVSGFSSSPSDLNELQIFSSYGFFKDGYSKYGLGQSLLLIPWTKAFRAAKEALNASTYFPNAIAVYLSGPLVGSSVITFFFLICRKLGYPLHLAFILSLILGFTTMIWPYTQTLFSDPTMGFSWLMAFYALLAYRNSRKNGWLVLSGTAVGFSVLTKIVAAYAVPIFCGYFFYLLISSRGENWKVCFGIPFLKTIAAFFIPMVVMGIAILKYNQLRYGNFFSFGYLDLNTYDIRDSIFGFNVPFLAGLYGLLLSSGKGFFFYNPSALLGLVGWKRFYRRHPAEAWFLFALVGGMILVYSKWYGWHGDWSWGLRYLSCLPPFIMLMAAPVLEDCLESWRKKQRFIHWQKGLFLLLIVVSCFIQILGLSIQSKDYILTASKTELFKGGFFSPDWPIRDDSLQLHFIPEFSPLAGHWWMMRVIANRENPEMSRIFQNPPWRSIKLIWKPDNVRLDRFRYNVWWLHILTAKIDGLGGMLGLAGVLGSGFVVFVIWGWRQCCLHPP